MAQGLSDGVVCPVCQFPLFVPFGLLERYRRQILAYMALDPHAMEFVASLTTQHVLIICETAVRLPLFVDNIKTWRPALLGVFPLSTTSFLQ